MSIKIGKHIKQALTECTELNAKVKGRIYPCVFVGEPTASNMPFIRYDASVTDVEYVKGENGAVPAKDTCTVNIDVCAKDYEQAITLADLARKALEGKCVAYADFAVTDAVVNGMNTEFEPDLVAYVCGVDMTITTEPVVSSED